MKKNGRSGNKKIKLRSSTRVIYMIIALVLFAVSSSNIFQEVINKGEEKQKKEIYSYTNKSQTKYAMKIKDNKFVEEDTLPMGQTYVTDLLESMDINIDYQYDASRYTEVQYTYDVTATICGNYSLNGEDYNVWNKKYTLLEPKSGVSQKDIKISEAIEIDLPKYNKEVNDFKQAMGMTIDAYLNKDVTNEYSSDFKLTLGSKITNIETKEKDIKVGSLTEENTVENEVNIFNLIVNIIILSASIYTLSYIWTKTKVAHSIKNEYKLELNRILKSCQDKIIMITKKLEIEQSNVVDVKDFVELIKLSEELYKPILYWNSDNEQEAWFCVISNAVTYRFVLKKY